MARHGQYRQRAAYWHSPTSRRSRPSGFRRSRLRPPLPHSGGRRFPTLKADKFGSKGGTATKKIGPFVRTLAAKMPSLADRRLSPNHSWRHRLIEECRRIPIREDIEHALIGHAQEGTAPDYGEYAINTMLGPAIDKTRSPFDIGAEEGNEDIAPFVAAFPDEPEPNRLPMTETGNPLGAT